MLEDPESIMKRGAAPLSARTSIPAPRSLNGLSSGNGAFPPSSPESFPICDIFVHIRDSSNDLRNGKWE